jgi:hypothetical protein
VVAPGSVIVPQNIRRGRLAASPGREARGYGAARQTCHAVPASGIVARALQDFMSSERHPEDAAPASPESRQSAPAAGSEQANGGPPARSRSGVRARTWLIGLLVAAVGAALTNLITGGISSGFDSAWDAITGASDPPPLTVSARVERDRRSAFVFEQRLSGLSPPPPADPSSPQARVSWAERNGGIDAFNTALTVVIQGRSDASVILSGLTVDVVSRDRPPTGTFAPALGAGGIGVRYFLVDLDQRSPEAVLGELNEPQPGQRPINFPYKVSLSDPEVFMIFASTERCDCRWILKLHWQSGDKEGTTTIRDGDEPFRTASGSAARDQV